MNGDGSGFLVEDLFLKNKKSEYADTYAAIMALRFHGTEADIVSKKRLLKAANDRAPMKAPIPIMEFSKPSPVASTR